MILVDWNDAAFAFHFRKGLPSRITDQLALTGQRLKTLQQLINQTIKINNCYHEKVWSNRKTDSTPSTSKNEDTSKHRSSKKFPLKPSTPFASSLASGPKRSTESASVLNKEGQLNGDERARREKKGLCFYCCGKHDSRFILFDSSNQPYRVLLDSGANVSFISLEFAKRQSLPLTEITSFPVYLVNSLKEPSFWVSKKTKWTFHFSNFPSFEWDLTVLDAPGMDDTILGHDFLVYWNPDVNWQEGVINLRTNTSQSANLSPVNQELNSLPDSVIKLDNTFPPGDLQYPDFPSSLSLSDHGVIAYCSNLPLPTFFEEKAEPSIQGFLYSMILSHPPSTAIPSLEDDEDIKDLETIRKTLLPVYHDYADVFSPVRADKLPPHRPYNHQIELTENSLYAKLSKCEFHNSSLQFLGVIVSSDGPSSTSPPFSLKKAFTMAPILAHFSELAQTLIETNASDYAVAGLISQYYFSKLLHPVAFESWKNF
ncbi:hypothetical protein VP01_2273g2 [Puccinia sorghi]|uniref:Reverse transcriptase/retrotransposon-derived protein RNase H-like domain-containing protein n=1 Tax=Puccinia sorghi TaxID=27349 RepID=A0A0L6V8Y0_9BASI|nr:hypothetical protein VP01_2273g2 [Puccinia sorghi]